MTRTHLLALSLSALSALLFACGGATLDLGDGDSGGGSGDSGSTSDADHAPDGAQGCTSDPVPCSDGCFGTYSPVCENGAWVCPATGGPVCLVDAGNQADASCPLVPIRCVDYCGGTYNPVCVAGTWECPNHPGPPACPYDAGNPSPLACGNLVCDANTQYCYQSGGGAQLPDGGSNFTASCLPIPAQCQATPTCACIQQGMNTGCGCTDNGGVSIGCFYP